MGWNSFVVGTSRGRYHRAWVSSSGPPVARASHDQRRTAMSRELTRRCFLKSAAGGGAILGLGDLSFLSRLRPVGAAEARLDPQVVRLQPEIEPLVRLLEDTPREKLLEVVAARIQHGLSYRDLL